MEQARAELLRPKAEENRKAGNAAGGKSFLKSEMTFPETKKINTTAEAAKFAGVSVDTIAKVKQINLIHQNWRIKK